MDNLLYIIVRTNETATQINSSVISRPFTNKPAFTKFIFQSFVNAGLFQRVLPDLVILTTFIFLL